jgi:uncharacterized protein with ParB-like and HNH nuclease domain
MKANEKSFLRFLEGTDKQFVIPVYQRNYDWNKEQCEQLFNDILELSKSPDRTHFIGSIVSIYHDDGSGREYLIIDGQQRITTLSVLLLAIYNMLEKGEISSKNIINQQIKDEYLVNKYSPEEKKVRLKPIKADNDAFFKLFGRNEDYVPDSNITNNYLYFKDRLKRISKSIDEFFNAIKRLMIVEIELKRGEDDPQLIFESLNSTGLTLTQADLVRNFILMKESSSRQEELYENYWSNIEKNTNNKVSGFIRDFLTLKERVIPNRDKVYNSFKKYVQNNYSEKQVEDLLKELLKFSKFYNIIINNNDNSKEINKSLKKINNLEVTVSYPFLLEVFEKYDGGDLDESSVITILKIIESFAFRRLIADVPTNALNKIFMTLGKEIEKSTNGDADYIEVMRYILISKKGSQRFPNDHEFFDKLKLRDIYNLKSKNKQHLLESLENFQNKEKVNVEELLKSGEINIEHIMPQKLTPKWKENLGENWSEIHENYLNTLGNISLTGYNSKMSNKSFIEKRDMEKGFKESRLLLNKDLSELNTWSKNEIENRANKLCKIALEIWKYPQTNFVPKKDTSNLYSLSDDHEFTGEKVESFIFLDQEYEASNWRDLYQKIALILYDKDPKLFSSFLEDPDFKNKKRNMVSKNKKDLHTPLTISDTLYLECHLSAESILNMIRLILKKYDQNEDDVSIYLKVEE